jgi:hypothetical protein
MGFFSSLFRSRPKPAVQVEKGLSYRIVNPFLVEVLIAPKWVEFDGEAEDLRKPSRDNLSRIKKLNAVADCKTESEAYAVATVLDHIQHFCENCGQEVEAWYSKCDDCKKPLWKGKKKMEMVVVHVP